MTDKSSPPQENKPEAEESKTARKRRRRIFLFGFFAAGFLTIVSFMILDIAMGPLSSPEFCASCHEIEDAYNSWKVSAHHVNEKGISVKCIACHLPPRDHYVSHLAAKTVAGIKDTFVHIFSDDFDAEALRAEVLETLPGERCIYCHDNLLGKPRKDSLGFVHTAALARTEDSLHRCVACHNDLHGPKKVPPPKKKHEAGDNSFCYVCHVNWKKEFFVESHRKAGVSCYDCHGISEPHMDDEEHLTPPEIMYTKDKVNASCMVKCHQKKVMEKTRGHKPFFAGATDQKYCTECHGKHRLDKRERRWDRVTRKLIEFDGRPVTEEEVKKLKEAAGGGMGGMGGGME